MHQLGLVFLSVCRVRLGVKSEASVVYIAWLGFSRTEHP